MRTPGMSGMVRLCGAVNVLLALAVSGLTGFGQTPAKEYIYLGSRMIAIEQVGAGVTVSPLTFNMPAAGGPISIVVTTAQSSTTWSASSQSPWLTISSGSSGTGSGTVSVQAAANLNLTSRQGTVTVNGTVVTVSQAGAGAESPVTASPTTVAFSLAGGTSNVSISATSGAAWTAQTTSPWITFPNGASGSGSGSLSIQASATSAFRWGTVTLPGATIYVYQGTGTSQPALVTPIGITGTGATRTFTISASDSNGAGNISELQAMINFTFDGKDACYLYVTPADRRIYLYKNDPSLPAETGILGQPGTIGNSQCEVNLGGGSLALAGNNLTVTLPISFTPLFAGTKNVYTQVSNRNGSINPGGLLFSGSFTAFPAPPLPTIESVTPSSGSGTTQIFSVRMKSEAGATALLSGWFIINSTVSDTGGCYFVYRRSLRTFHAMGPGNTVTASGVAGATGVLDSTYCTLDLAQSSVGELGDEMVAHLHLTFKPAFTGQKNLYAYVFDRAGQNDADGWQDMGDWTPTGTSAPLTNVSVSQGASSGAATIYEASVYAAAGASTITSTQIRFSPNGPDDLRDGCLVDFNAQSGVVSLAKDGYSWEKSSFWLPTTGTLGASTVLANSQCKVYLANSSVSLVSSVLKLKLAIEFLPLFAGPKGVYMISWAGAAVTPGGPTYLGKITPYPTPAPPTALSVSPASGSGASANFTYRATTPLGGNFVHSLITSVESTFNSGPPSYWCKLLVHRSSKMLMLTSAAGVSVSGWLGDAATLSNGQCSINLASANLVTAGTAGEFLDFTAPITFTANANFQGLKNNYLMVLDKTVIMTPVQFPPASDVGDWTVNGGVTPIISGQQANSIGPNSATIIWSTNVAADSQVEYGTSPTSYNSQTPLDTTMTTSHSVSLTGLLPGTTYYARVKSKNFAGDTATPQALQFTTTAPACSISPTAVTLPNAGGSVQVTVNCVAGLSWTSSVNGTAWASVAPATGTGPQTVVVTAVNAGGGSQRTATLTIAGKPLAVTQRAASVIVLTPASASAGRNQSVDFSAVVDGVSTNCTVTWSLSPAVGTISSCGKYTAPATIQANQTSVVVYATDPVNNGTATASLTLTPYAPPAGLSVSPSSGSAANTTLTFSITDPVAASSISELQFLIHTNNTDTSNACYVSVRLGTNVYPPNGMLLRVNSASSWSGPVAVGAANTILYNSQCQIDVGSSTVATSGNTVSVSASLKFKPGFTGMKFIYMQAGNATGAYTYWTQVGTWDLSANPAATAPIMSVAAPADGATVSGTVNVTGWALDNATRVENDITSVGVYIDNVFKGYATLGQTSTACNTYPGRMGCPNVGFTYSLNTGLLTNGAHTLKVVAADGDVPARTVEVVRSITVNNLVPPAVIVTPANPYVRMLDFGLPSDTRQFSATVDGSPSTAVTWSLSTGLLRGSIATGGLYTPPNASSASPGDWVEITATRQSNPADTGTTKVTLMGWLAPAISAMGAGQSSWFMNNLGDVTFTLSPNIGTISSTGIYTAPSSYTPGTVVTITATGSDQVRRQQALVTLIAQP